VLKYNISMKIHPVGADCFIQTDRRTDMTKLIVCERA